MTPSRIQFCLAAHSGKISISVGAVVSAVFWGGCCMPFSFWTIYGVIIALPLGAILGALFLGPFLFAIASRINGAPFCEGDYVQILIGPYRGRVARVYKLWKERNQVRVELGEQERIAVKDVFSHDEICRAERPSHAPEQTQFN